ARVCQQLREGAYKARPGSLFGIYSGLQDPICKKRYTTDWRYLGDSCDYAVGTIGSFEVTHEALGETPLMGREGIYHFPTYQYNVSRLMRTYVDSGGYGLRMFSLHYYDGQILQGAAKLSRFMAQYSDILMNHHRQDDLASSADEKLQPRVLVGEGGRRLIVLINNTGDTRETTIEVNDLDGKWRGRLYHTGRAVENVAHIPVSVGAWSVEAIDLQRVD
ncbi:MAG: hypothetical protein R6V19_07650, partial [Armatimonadota bacterium]